jgi:hypothetical protein
LRAAIIRTGIWIVCEPESFRSSSLGIIHKTESLDFACAAENVGDLLFGQAWKKSQMRCDATTNYGNCGLTIGNIADKDDARGWSCRHVEVSVMRVYLEEGGGGGGDIEVKEPEILAKVKSYMSQGEDKKRWPKM